MRYRLKGREIFSHIFLDSLIVKRSFIYECVFVLRFFEDFVWSFEEFVLKSFKISSLSAARLLEELGVIFTDWDTWRSESSLSVRRKRATETLMTYLW